VEIGDGWVIKRKMVVLADAEADDVRGKGFEKGGVAAAFGGGIGGQAIEEMDGLEKRPF
jgi:hypothetical protein